MLMCTLKPLQYSDYFDDVVQLMLTHDPTKRPDSFVRVWGRNKIMEVRSSSDTMSGANGEHEMWRLEFTNMRGVQPSVNVQL